MMEKELIVALIASFVLACLIFALIYFKIKINSLENREKRYKQLIDESLETFAHAIDAKDPDTNGHSVRVAYYSREIARRMGWEEQEQERIYCMGMLHDIGKIGIPDSILKKPDRLTENEMEIIRSHPSIGGEILKDFRALKDISEGARYHHERFDGNGYNEGLKGEEIPLCARIICVADCYDTMASRRVYKENHDENYILEELKRCSGTHFDPKVVPYMVEMIQDGTAPYELKHNVAIPDN